MLTERDDRPLLITGAAGFIGGEMARHFAGKGLRVAGSDLPGRPVDHLASCGVTFIDGDVTRREDCDRILRDVKPRAIVHCAAAMGGAVPREEFMRVNVGGTRALADASIAARIRRLIFISSVTVHGMPARAGVTEASGYHPIGLPYADSKIATEELLREHQQRGDLEVTILRPADVYGPRSGEWVVKLVQALRARKMILIGGGGGLINLTYVDNLSDAVLASLASPSASGRDYLITDGAPVTWRSYLTDLARAAEASPPGFSIPLALAWPLVVAMEATFPLAGRRPPLGRMGLRLLSSRTSYSIEKARSELSWSPAVEYAEGMERVAAWIRGAMPAVAA